MSKYPFSLYNLLHLVTPFFLGNPARATYPVEEINRHGVFWENCIYIGIIPLVLAIAALSRLRKEARIRYHILIVLLGIALALGIKTPLYSILWKTLPGFHLFRFPSRFLFFSIFGLAMLSGIGWDMLSSYMRTSRVKTAVFAAVILLITLNVLWFNRAYNAAVPPQWLSPPSSFRFLPTDDLPFRIYTFAAKYAWQRAYLDDGGWMGDRAHLDDYRNLLAPDYSLLFHVPQVGEKTYIEGGMAPSRRARIEEIMERQSAPRIQGNVAFMSDEAVKILRMENVHLLFSTFVLAHSDIARISSDDGSGSVVKVYRMRSPLPHAYVVHRCRYAESPDAALSAVLSSDFNPAREVVLEERSPLEAAPLSGAGEPQKIRERDDRVEIELSLATPGFLFMSDTFYPGWKAYVDGREQKILIANYAFRALALSEGSHHVLFIYRPASFIAGLVISVSSWLAVLLFSILVFFKRRA